MNEIETLIRIEGDCAIYEIRPSIWMGIQPAPVRVVKRRIHTEGEHQRHLPVDHIPEDTGRARPDQETLRRLFGRKRTDVGGHVKPLSPEEIVRKFGGPT